MGGYSLSDDMVGTEPLFRAIAEIISASIADGSFVEGEKLPSASEFARTYSVNVATAARGLRLLERHGVLGVRRGIGFYVAPNARELVRQERLRGFTQRFVTPLAEEAARLEISLEELLERIASAVDEHADK